MTDKPTIGRIVHYLNHGSPVLPDGSQKYKPECRAAIVTQNILGFMDSELTGMAVLNPSGLFFEFGCPQDESKSIGGSWHWPERV
jgi:hypothetical protein